MLTKFDKREIYNDVIKEKVTDLIQACNKERMPVFISVCVKNDEDGTEYEKEMFASASNDINLKEDQIPKYVNVSNGFRTVPPVDVVEIEFD